MDIHHVKSEEHRDIQTMIHQMEKLPEFYEQTMIHQYSAAIEASEKQNSMAAMREMMYGIAAMQPINIDPESVKPRKRRNVRISKDPQSVAARLRRERISERIRILQRIVPNGTKMDTASMLDEAIHYVKFLKKQLHSLQIANALGFPVAVSGELSNGGKTVHQQILGV